MCMTIVYPNIVFSQSEPHLNPPASAEKEHLTADRRDDDRPEERVGARPVELGDVRKIHPIHAA